MPRAKFDWLVDTKVCAACGENVRVVGRGMCGRCYGAWWSKANPSKGRDYLRKYRQSEKGRRTRRAYLPRPDVKVGNAVARRA